jgi:antitoxin HicB
MTYTVVLLREADGGYSVTVPALKGCWTQGDSLPEALDMAKEAIEGYLACLAAAGDDPPADVDHITFDWTEETVEAVAYRVMVPEVAQVA